MPSLSPQCPLTLFSPCTFSVLVNLLCLLWSLQFHWQKQTVAASVIAQASLACQIRPPAVVFSTEERKTSQSPTLKTNPLLQEIFEKKNRFNRWNPFNAATKWPPPFLQSLTQLPPLFFHLLLLVRRCCACWYTKGSTSFSAGHKLRPCGGSSMSAFLSYGLLRSGLDRNIIRTLDEIYKIIPPWLQWSWNVSIFVTVHLKGLLAHSSNGSVHLSCNLRMIEE